MVAVALVLAAIGLGGFIVQSARERGRSGVLWGTGAGIAAVAGALGEAVVFAQQGTPAVFSGVLFLGAPLVSLALVLGLLHLLPETVPAVAGGRWTMLRLGTRDQAAGEVVLAFDGLALHVGDVTLQPADIRELVADGECLRIGWAGGGAATLLPTSKRPLSWRENAKRSQALERHLNVLLRRNRAAA